MAKSIHFKCVRVNGWPKNVKDLIGTRNFSSGYWEISEEEAKALIGGLIYLHDTKADPSYRGGLVSAFETTFCKEFPNPNRISLIFQPSFPGVGQQWRGKDHIRAWTSGLVDCDLPHETA